MPFITTLSDLNQTQIMCNFPGSYQTQIRLKFLRPLRRTDCEKKVFCLVNFLTKYKNSRHWQEPDTAISSSRAKLIFCEFNVIVIKTIHRRSNLLKTLVSQEIFVSIGLWKNLIKNSQNFQSGKCYYHFHKEFFLCCL